MVDEETRRSTPARRQTSVRQNPRSFHRAEQRHGREDELEDLIETVEFMSRALACGMRALRRLRNRPTPQPQPGTGASAPVQPAERSSPISKGRKRKLRRSRLRAARMQNAEAVQRDDMQTEEDSRGPLPATPSPKPTRDGTTGVRSDAQASAWAHAPPFVPTAVARTAGPAPSVLKRVLNPATALSYSEAVDTPNNSALPGGKLSNGGVPLVENGRTAGSKVEMRVDGQCGQCCRSECPGSGLICQAYYEQRMTKKVKK
jgi:hypothetical protein